MFMFERRNGKPGARRWIKATAIVATAVALVSMAIVGTVAAQTGQLFDDVPRGHYAHDSVQWAVENGITRGCGDGHSFCPERTLNRAEMVTFLKRYHDKFGSETSPGTGPDGGSGTGPGTSESLNEWTLDGWGSDEESVSLPAGRYSVSFALEYQGNLGDAFDGVTLTAEDSNGRIRTLIDGADNGNGDLRTGYTDTGSFTVPRVSLDIGTRLLQLDPGRIYLGVELHTKPDQARRTPWAAWEIVVSER